MIELTPIFQRSLDLMESGRQHLFITGRAGTGKSTLLNYFRQTTRKQVAVLAPTGVAAVNVRGETVHSFFGFKPSITKADAEKMARRLLREREGKDAEVYVALDAIVIDEVSMMRADLLDCVDAFLRVVRKSRSEAFGGARMIFIGDLFQLPPVVSSHEREVFSGKVYEGPHFFHAHVLRDLSFEMIELEKVYRQSDAEFVRVLNGVRNRSLSVDDLRALNSRHLADFKAPVDAGYVVLTATNDQADSINAEQLEQLVGHEKIFRGELSGEFEKRQLPTETNLHLKIGAQVMLLNNDPRGRWVNGTIGIVKSMEDDGVEVKLETGETEFVEPFVWEMFHHTFDEQKRVLVATSLGTFRQIPMKLAWAVTIHKGQGKTFDRVIIDSGRGFFAPGQMYVALSRCRTLEGMVLRRPLAMSQVMVDRSVLQFMRRHSDASAEEVSPLEEKIARIADAIDEQKMIEILYLNAEGGQSRRVLQPLFVGEMEYSGRRFDGLRAICRERRAERTFRIDRIMELKVVEGEAEFLDLK